MKRAFIIISGANLSREVKYNFNTVSLVYMWSMGLILTDFRWSRTTAMLSVVSKSTMAFSKDRRHPYQSKDSIDSHKTWL